MHHPRIAAGSRGRLRLERKEGCHSKIDEACGFPGILLSSREPGIPALPRILTKNQTSLDVGLNYSGIQAPISCLGAL
jgi:hypothetical protein